MRVEIFSTVKRMDLPLELQEEYLLKLHPDDILAYCQTSRRAQQICNSSSFWDQKSLREFGFPLSLICAQSYYWQYKLLEEIYGTGALLGSLVRAGRFDLAENYIEENDANDAIESAIRADDIVTLRFLEPYVREQWNPEEYYAGSRFFLWLRLAFMHGSVRAVNYLTSIDPDYLSDWIILEDIWRATNLWQTERGMKLLRPYIERHYREFPGVLGDPEVPEDFRDYILANF